MLKRLFTGAAVVASLGVLLSILPPTSAKPSPLDKANKDLTNTEAKIAGQLADVEKTTTQIAETNNPKAMLEEMASLDKKRENLMDLQTELEKDIAVYESLRASKATEVERELNLIYDKVLQRKVGRKFDRAYKESGKRILAARETIGAMGHTVAGLEDLKHARVVLDGSNTLEMAGDDLSAQIAHAQTVAAQLSNQAEQLIARMTQAETDTLTEGTAGS